MRNYCQAFWTKKTQYKWRRAPWTVIRDNETRINEILNLSLHYSAFGRMYTICVLFNGFVVTRINIMTQHSGLSGNVAKQTGVSVEEFTNI